MWNRRICWIAAGGSDLTGWTVNSVGAGDSMVAGFITGYLNTKDMEKAFRLGVAAGSASAFCSWLATRDEIVALLGEPAEVYHI